MHVIGVDVPMRKVVSSPPRQLVRGPKRRGEVSTRLQRSPPVYEERTPTPLGREEDSVPTRSLLFRVSGIEKGVGCHMDAVFRIEAVDENTGGPVDLRREPVAVVIRGEQVTSA